MTDSKTLGERLHAALTDATRTGDRIAINTYQSAVAALDDTEALDPTEQRAVLGAEIVARRRAADDFAGTGRPTDALRLWAQADLLQALLG